MAGMSSTCQSPGCTKIKVFQCSVMVTVIWICITIYMHQGDQVVRKQVGKLPRTNYEAVKGNTEDLDYIVQLDIPAPKLAILEEESKENNSISNMPQEPVEGSIVTQTREKESEKSSGSNTSSKVLLTTPHATSSTIDTNVINNSGRTERTLRNNISTNISQLLSTASDVPDVFVRGINCSALFHNSSLEQQKAREMNFTSRSAPSLEPPWNCDAFRKERGYLELPTTAEEAEYPIAFSLMLYREPSMAERLLRAIYRPQNIYCIHIDKKSPESVLTTMRAVADCFPNVFLSSERINVTWGTMGNVEQELACMRELWNSANKWRYLINLTGEEFPLKTNTQIVRMLKSFNGTNAVHGSKKWANTKRWGNLKAHPLPYNISLTKGSKLFAVTRGYVDFMLHSPISHAFLKWAADTEHPDETFFSSLNHSPWLGVPGAHTMLDEDGKHCPHLLRFLIWMNKKVPHFRCHGKKVHSLCIFSVKDLPLLASRPQMFVNKFHSDYHPLAYDCMEELHYNRTRQEITSATSL